MGWRNNSVHKVSHGKHKDQTGLIPKTHEERLVWWYLLASQPWGGGERRLPRALTCPRSHSETLWGSGKRLVDGCPEASSFHTYTHQCM